MDEAPLKTVKPRRRRPKAEATRKQLLLVSSSGDGPWCKVSYARCVEVLGASLATSIRIVVRDESSRTPLFTYTKRGSGLYNLNVPRGEMRIKRTKGTEPITVIAYCGP